MKTPIAPRKSGVAVRTPVAATPAPRCIPSRTGWESVSRMFEDYFLQTRERT